ncbi:electron transport complex subunit RsxC [Nitrincola iocasae]|uniref:Ion-translocating oxidoreductase complex subunit C n=1 Tax=Nitrincola iocasae TaxID=2614693 RepID=A0A5J6LEB9_9GAMM|nr:electron transport complex subunit RsxC [Nitrincola iocasae]QEW06940.1 electron transport complex subunit RsxC [Nitrincola iocasae]
MSRVYSFHGGVHPPENKRQSLGAPIRQAPLPSRLILPLQQHIGKAATPLVEVGQTVLKGQKIAEPNGHISAAIHAPSSGTVAYIGLQPVPHASGLESPCIVIETDGEDRWIERELLPDYRSVSKKNLIRHIRESGIAGLGGAGFPTDIKLNLGQDHIVNTLIINAAECEPYITADDALMRERPDEILSGIEIIAHILEPSHTLIGIEDNKPNAIKALREAIRKRNLSIDLMVVPTRYPSGGEKQLIQLLTDVEIPSGSIPADVGIVCQNVGTAAAVYRAVEYGEPLISRIVTLTGFALGHRQNYEVLIGTPFSTLLESAEVDRSRLFRLVMGGPMMGISVEDDRIPVIKTTNCIIAATREEMPPAPPAQPCIRCGMCEQVCPASLLPQQLYWFAKGREFDKARHHNLFDCIECGACAYVCPSNIPLVQHYRFAKSEIRNEQAEQLKAAQARERFEARQARLAREVEEKELRRKERAETASREQARKKAEAELSSSAPPDPEAELKKLKTAASIARTKLKKAREALKNAREKGLEGTDKLDATVTQLEQSAEAAEQAWQHAAGEQN